MFVRVVDWEYKSITHFSYMYRKIIQPFEVLILKSPTKFCEIGQNVLTFLTSKCDVSCNCTTASCVPWINYCVSDHEIDISGVTRYMSGRHATAICNHGCRGNSIYVNKDVKFVLKITLLQVSVCYKFAQSLHLHEVILVQIHREVPPQECQIDVSLHQTDTPGVPVW